jgi:hypothetical protein
MKAQHSVAGQPVFPVHVRFSKGGGGHLGEGLRGIFATVILGLTAWALSLFALAVTTG